MNLSQEQWLQIKEFDNCFIEHEDIRQIYVQFNKLRENKINNLSPESLLLTGDTGVGKKSLINNYLKDIKPLNRWAPHPVISIDIPIELKPRNLLTEFLIALSLRTQGKTINRRTNNAYIEGIVKELTEKKTELIIIQQIHDLLEVNTRVRRDIGKLCNIISKKSNISFILVGEPYATHLIDEPFFDSLLSLHKEMTPFEIFKLSETDRKDFEIKEDESVHFAEFVIGLGNRMGFLAPPNLATDDILFPLFLASKGECKRLKLFLRDAMHTTFTMNKKTIDAEVLKITFDNRYPKETNPFLSDWEKQVTTMIESMRVANSRLTDNFELGFLLNQRNKALISSK